MMEETQRHGRWCLWMLFFVLLLGLPPVLGAEEMAAVAGRVVNGEGRPVAGAAVFVVADPSRNIYRIWARNSLPRFGTLTNADGQFHVDGLEPMEELYRIRVASPGYAPTIVALDAFHPAETRRLTLTLRPGRTVTGRLAGPDGEPVAGARLHLAVRGDVTSGLRLVETSGEGSPAYSVEGDVEAPVSGPDGRFALPDREAGAFNLEIEAPGYVSRFVACEISAGAGVLELDTVEMVRGASVEVQVTDSEGRPARFAWVRVEEGPRRFLTTGRDGRFVLEDVEPGRPVRFTVRKDSENVAMEVVPPTAEPVRVVLGTTGILVTGKLLDEDGEPIGYGRVGQSHSDANGRFRLRLTPGKHRLVAHANGYRGEVLWLELNDRDLTGYDVVLRPESNERDIVVAGRVIGPDGEPAAGATVSVDGRSEVVEADGGYRVAWIPSARLAPGYHVVHVTHDRYAPAARGVEIVEGLNAVDFQLETGQELRGWVLDENGNGVPNVSLSLWQVASLGGFARQPGLSRDDGSFVLPHLVPGLFRILARKAGWADAVVGPVALEDAPVEIRLHKGEPLEPEDNRERDAGSRARLEDDDEPEIETGNVEGRLLDRTTRQPVALAEVALVQPEKEGLQVASVESDFDGAFRMMWVPAGNYQLVVRKDGYEHLERSFEVETGGEHDVELSLNGAEEVIVDLLLPSGWPPPNVFVEAVDQRTSRRIDFGFTRVRPGGRLVLRRLPRGTWTLFVRTLETATSSVEVEVPGPPRSLQLEEPGGPEASAGQF